MSDEPETEEPVSEEKATVDPMYEELNEYKWASVVYAMLRENPSWATATVKAMQAGILAALDRIEERASTLSLGYMIAFEAVPAKNRAKMLKRYPEGVQALADSFKGAPWGREVQDWINSNTEAEKENNDGQAREDQDAASD